ncbi:MAG TPA: HD domain-containing phosphohydrolase [Spirochaetota bacterium]|nr:HD domain-containing phosphohydrolase [Spirochaetota bacterium]HOM39204.1 HD domain-containing phosphohydrolase [Spirochaetota bacterium]HPQ49239.1 HD domain-containing phosphohydrolase [Spirochaetota bacterium]
MFKKLLFVFLILPFIFYAGPKEDSKKLYDEGVKLYKDGKIDESINILRESIKLDNTNFWAKKQLAEILAQKAEDMYNKGYQKTAYELFKEGFRYFPNHQGIVYWINKLKPIEAKLEDKPISETKQEGKQEILKEEEKKDIKKEGESESKVIEVKKEEKQIDLQKDLDKIEQRFNEKLFKVIEAMSRKENKPVIIPQVSTPVISKDEIKESIKSEIDEIKKKISSSESNLNNETKSKINVLSYFLIAALGLLVFSLIITLVVLLIKRDSKSKKVSLKSFNPANAHYFQELTKLYKMEELLEKIEKKDITWEGIQKYISELDKKIRFEILYLIENKITRDNNPINNSVLETLSCLMSDPDEYLQTRAKYLINQSLQLTYANKLIESPKSLPSDTNRLIGISDKRVKDNKKSFIDSELIDLRIAMPLAKIIDRKLFKQSHSQNVGRGVYYVSQELGIDQQELELYYVAGLLHDIGYFDVFSEVITKKGKLTQEECNVVKNHPQKGVELLDFATIPSIVYEGILYHHERFDGSGYPKGLKGKEIPLSARIIGVVDAFEAMTSPRPYRPPMDENEAIRKIREGIGISFDPEVVDAFEKVYNMGLIEKEKEGILVEK